MKNLIKFLLSALLTASFTMSFGQMKNIGTFMAGGTNDAELLLREYITPWANALGTGLSGGWYNTAKTHKLGGFDITFTANMGFVPEADKTFDLRELQLEGQHSGNIAQTAAGKDESGPRISYFNDRVAYNTPKGIGLGFIPSPMVQLGIGFIKGTDITGRFMPAVELGNAGSFGLWGVGLKHDILQWLPLAEKVPVLHVSIHGGYTKLNYKKSLSFEPDQIGVPEENVTLAPDCDFNDQELDLTVKSLTVNLLVSADLPVISFYGGVGIANTKTEMALNGYYPVPEINQGEVVVNIEQRDADPVKIDIENNEGSPTKPRLNIGMRLKLGVFTIHGDYTKANYSNVTVGLGFSFR